MDGPTVLVKKSGFFSAVATGFFSVLTVLILTGGGVAIYGMHLMDRNVDRFSAAADKFIEVLPAWQAALPPMLADAIRDRRDPAYREQVKVSIEPAAGGRHSSNRTIIEVTNTGSETISLLAVRLTYTDERGELGEAVIYPATPLAVDDSDLRGPIMPGQTRRVARHLRGLGRSDAPQVEITELRIWESKAAGEPLAAAVTVDSQP